MTDSFGVPADTYTEHHWRIFPAMPTTRDLLDAAASYVAEHERLAIRPAKAKVHDMPLAELVNLPPVRVMLYEAARSAA